MSRAKYLIIVGLLGAEGGAGAWDGYPLGGMAKAPCLSIN